MSTVTVTVGRDVHGVPMPSTDWTAYQSDVRRALDTSDATVYAYAKYRGHWESGYFEDAAIWHAEVPDDVVDPLRDALTGIASAYDQDAIGLAVGHQELVRGPRP